MKKQETNCKESHLSKTLAIACIIIICIWLTSWGLIDLMIIDVTQRGVFGDKFGAINALFSGLAFAGLIITLLYQKEELKLQREELAQTREELKGQRQEFEEQNKTLKRQRFENTFFNLLKLQQEIVTNLSYDDISITKESFFPPKFTKKHTLYEGRNVFQELYLNLTISTKNNISYRGIKGAIQTKGYLVYSDIHETSIFDHYFRHLYRIIKYIDKNDLIEDCERYEYTCIVRSQLSDYEIILLFYNCLTSNGAEKFKPLIEKYALLKNLRDELLASMIHKEKYNKSAFCSIKE